MKKLVFGAAAAALVLGLIACSPSSSETSVKDAEIVAAAPAFDSAHLESILMAQSDEKKGRYEYRHPSETLEFFQIAPGMTVVDALPGNPGWYTEILLPYLGEDGDVIGADYAMEMWPEFGGFATPEFIEGRKSWAADWEVAASNIEGDTNASVTGITLGLSAEDADVLAGSADRVLFIRAMHNLHRFEDKGGYLTDALMLADTLLKPGGMIGVVQHRAPEENSDDWADGSNGYLKQSAVIALMEEAGFEFVASSEINANPNDLPSEEDVVWRLPPTLGTSAEDETLRAEMTAIGESDRMTLLFKKPE